MKTAACRLPRMALAAQQLVDSEISDIPAVLSASLSSLNLGKQVSRGETVAIALGSRGIDRIDAVARACVAFFSELGLTPVIVPAMGSHGGGTPEGQRRCLEALGITEAATGAPIDADDGTTMVGTLDNGLPIHIAVSAWSSDHVVVINRIKPHTKFRGAIESGLCKMMTIGLGKVTGAGAFHRHAVQEGFGAIETAAARILESGKILCGVALVENGCSRLAHIECLGAGELIPREKQLLHKATQWMGSIPFDPVDLLIVDTIGKNISGIGMDSNITGRHRDITGDFYTAPHVKRIFVRELSPGSDGNGNGIGLADFTTQRLVNALDMEKTVTNALAAISPEKAAIPLHFKTDRQVLTACAQSLGRLDLETARIVRIKQTSSLSTLQVSEALLEELETIDHLSLRTPPAPMQFDPDGNLTPFPA
jgi:hypothetical protein